MTKNRKKSQKIVMKNLKKRFMFGKVLLWFFAIRKGRSTYIFRKSCIFFEGELGNQNGTSLNR